MQLRSLGRLLWLCRLPISVWELEWDMPSKNGLKEGGEESGVSGRYQCVCVCVCVRESECEYLHLCVSSCVHAYMRDITNTVCLI